MILKGNRYGLIAVAALLSAVLSSCLKNDIPYPTVEAQFLSITVEGQASAATIDTKNRVVTLNLSEQVDIKNVNITGYEVTEGATLSGEILGALDLSHDCTVTLSIYQDYTWRITASQPIDRYFSVEGQVGTTVIDTDARRVVAYVSESRGNSAVVVKTLKLGPAEVTTMSPDLVGDTVNFSSPKRVTVSYHNSEEQWTVYVETTAEQVSLTEVDAWTNVIWAYGSAQEGSTNGFEYRLQGASAWTSVPDSWVTQNGGSFSACIKNLAASTTYEVRAVSDDNVSTEQTVTTEGYLELPNASFDEWWQDGKVWCPWLETGEAFWGTGNKGATVLGDSNSVPSTDTWDGSTGYSAELNTKFVGIGSLGKLAAGNIFAGVYKQTDGTNGILDFGRPFTGRPTKLKGHWKYNCEAISHSSTEYTSLIGQPDTAVVYIALTNWSEPFEIRTRPSTRNLFDKTADYVIAYGEIQSGQSINGWTEFTVDLEYRNTSVQPSYILIVCTASKYGDYFTGGDGSTLYVDDFSLEWDY